MYDCVRVWLIRTSPEVDLEQGNGEAPDRRSSGFGWLTRVCVIALEHEAWYALVDALRAPIAVDPAAKGATCETGVAEPGPRLSGA